MEGIAKLLGIVMVGAGVIYFVKPNTMKKLVDYFSKENRLKIGGVVAIVLGIILLLAASECSVPWIIVLFGILALAKGILIFTLGQQKIKSMLNTLTTQPNKTLRVWAIVEIGLGVILIYSV